MMQNVIRNYGKFLEKTTVQFTDAARRHGVQCRRGCHECCANGFFDITLLDAIHLRARLRKVPAEVRKRVIARANEQLDILEKKEAFSRKNPVIRTLAQIDLVSRRSTRMSCPALENGACVLYEHRPHICRIFGPTVRGKRRAVHLEGCGYFERELPETDFSILDNYADEDVLLKAMFTKAGRKRVLELDTIIPAAIAMDLRKWL